MKMKRAIASVIAAAVVGLTGASVSADSFDPVVIGARTEGMGGAAIAAAGDLESVAANPAGLLTLSRGELLIGGRILEDTIATESATGAATTTGDRHTCLTLAGGAVPLRLGGRAWALAVAYERPLELVTFYKGGDIHGGVSAWSPAVAVELVPWLGVGAAVNIWDGTRDYDHDLADGSRLWWKSDYSGVNATVGLRFDLGRTTAQLPLTVGLNARTPFTLGIDYHERSATAAGVESAAAWTYQIEMPWMAGVGIAWEPSADVTLALEGEARFFKGSRNRATGSAGTDVTPLSASDDNLFPVRFGVEYRLHTGSLVIPLRAGVRSVPTLSADRRDGQPEGQATGFAFTGGIGVVAGRVRADLAYSSSQYARDTVVGAASTTTSRTYQTWMLQVAVGLGEIASR